MKQSTKQLLISGTSWLALLALIFLTDPKDAPLPLLILPFLLLGVTLFSTSKYFLQRLLPNMSPYRRGVAILLVVGLPMVFLVLSSVDQLTVRDALLLLILLALTVFYVRRSHIFNQ